MSFSAFIIQNDYTSYVRTLQDHTKSTLIQTYCCEVCPFCVFMISP